jgi:TrmH family RNA methyltransferase
MKSLIEKTILSASNTLLSEWRDCLQSKGIKKHGQFIISGERAVREVLELKPQLVRNLLLNVDHTERWMELAEQANALTQSNTPRFSIVALGKTIFDELDVAGTRAPLLVVRTPEIPQADLSQEPKGLEILCAMGDPSNVGALLRSAAAFGVSRVILLQEAATPFHPKAVRAASATTLTVDLAKGPSIKELPMLFKNGSVLALDMNGESIAQFAWPKDARLLIGEEGQGVPSSSAFKYLSIPMAKGVESLNAAIAASVAMYSYRSKN